MRLVVWTSREGSHLAAQRKCKVVSGPWVLGQNVERLWTQKWPDDKCVYCSPAFWGGIGSVVRGRGCWAARRVSGWVRNED